MKGNLSNFSQKSANFVKFAQKNVIPNIFSLISANLDTPESEK